MHDGINETEQIEVNCSCLNGLQVFKIIDSSHVNYENLSF
jgi:hypothetical protein